MLYLIIVKLFLSLIPIHGYGCSKKIKKTGVQPTRIVPRARGRRKGWQGGGGDGREEESARRILTRSSYDNRLPPPVRITSRR